MRALDKGLVGGRIEKVTYDRCLEERRDRIGNLEERLRVGHDGLGQKLELAENASEPTLTPPPSEGGTA